MKRYLVIGCAAVALCTAAGSASAQTKFDVMIGGDAFFQFGYVDQDLDQGLRSTEALNRFRLVVTPTAKADNGLEYGAHARIRASNENATVDADRAYIFAEGAFGRIQAGTDAGASDNFAYIGPVVDWGTFGSADGWWMSFLGPTGDNIPVAAQGQLRTLTSSDHYTRITYLTPSFSGLQGIISYGPSSDSLATNVNRSRGTTTPTLNGVVEPSSARASAYEDVYEVGAVYSGEFSGVTVEGSAFYSGGQAKDDTDGSGLVTRYEDLSSWQAGLQVGYAGFKVGGSYSNSYDSGYAKTGILNKTDQETIIAGLQYTTGPIIVGASYTYAQDGGDLDSPGKNKLNLYTVGGNYTVAPGLTVGLEYSYFDLDHNVNANDDKGSVIIFDTRVSF